MEEGSAPDEALPEPPTLHPSMLDFGYVPLGSQKILEQIIANTTKQPMIWLADAHESRWLSVAPDHGVLQPGEQQSTRVTADTRSLEPGEHSATLTFSSEGDETSMSEYTTGKIIVEEPILRPLEAGLDFGFLAPQSTAQSGLLITNPDDRPIEWRIQIGAEQPGVGVRETLENSERPAGIREECPIVDEEGIMLSETEGQLQAHESRTVYVTVNSTNLEPGYSYTANLALFSPTAQAPLLVPVTFYVNEAPGNDGGPRAPLGLPQSLNFTIASGQASANRTLRFTNDNPKVVDWKLNPQAGAKWLILSQSHGTFAPNAQATVHLTAKKVSVGNHNTGFNLTLTWDDGTPGSTDTPTIPVFLTVQ